MLVNVLVVGVDVVPMVDSTIAVLADVLPVSLMVVALMKAKNDGGGGGEGWGLTRSMTRSMALPSGRSMLLLKLARLAHCLCCWSGIRAICRPKEDSMPRQKSLLTVIRDLVQQEVRCAMQSLLGSVSTETRAKNGRRLRRRRRGPGRPPGSKNKVA